MDGHGFWLSILVPVYNVSNYIEECVDSIISQDLSGVEVIFLDDCSTDNSIVKLEKKLQDCPDKNLKLLRHDKNRGLSASRNRLLISAAGSYIWFIDSDDKLCMGIVRKIKEIIDSSDPDLLFFDFQKIHGATTNSSVPLGKQIKTFDRLENLLCNDSEELFAGLFARRQMYAWCRISKRKLWRELRFPEGRFFEDISIIPLLALNATSFYYLPIVGIYYRQREGSILSRIDETKVLHRLTALDGVLPQWRMRHPLISIKSLYLFYRFGVKNYFYAMSDIRSLGITNSQSKEYFFLAISSMNTSWANVFKCLLLYGDIKLAFKVLRIKLSL